MLVQFAEGGETADNAENMTDRLGAYSPKLNSR